MADEKKTNKLLKFLKDCKGELKKIVWSSKEDVTKNTAVVIVTVVISAVCIFALDIGFSKLLDLISNLG